MTRISQTCLTIMFLTIMFTAQAWAATLENGVPIKTSVNRMTFANVGIVVPDGATGMTVSITGGSDDLDLYLKYGSPLSGSSVAEFDADADFISDGPGADETISITPASIPALRAGTWYIGTLNLNATKVSFTIIATIDTGVDHTVPFSLNVDKTTVNFDWTAMVAANTYTLAVALADEVGDIDMSTLNLLDMGSSKTFSTSGLTSGMIFYATILADTDQGLEVSNTCQFMPIAGTVTYFDSGAEIIQIADPGGIGNFTVFGIFDGDTAHLTRISGDDGSGSFTLTVVNDRPAAYTKGDFSLNFTYDATGSIGILRTAKRAASSDLNDCQKIISDKRRKLLIDYDRDNAQLKVLRYQLACLISPSYLTNNSDYRSDIGLIKEADAKDKVWNIFNLINVAIEGHDMTYKEDLARLNSQYDECKDDPDPTPDPTPDPDNPVIIIDTSCPIPAGATFVEDNKDSRFPATYWLLGTDFVGPKKNWRPKAGGSLYLFSEICLNAQGQKNGWLIVYYQDGTMNYAEHYNNGVHDGHTYSFYEDGSLKKDYTYVNGIKTYGLVYNEDGSLKMWYDRDGDGVWHQQ